MECLKTVSTSFSTISTNDTLLTATLNRSRVQPGPLSFLGIERPEAYANSEAALLHKTHQLTTRRRTKTRIDRRSLG